MKTTTPMFFLIFCIVGLFAIFVWFFGKSAKKEDPIEFVEINGNRVKVELARTPAERSKGLMFRASMAENAGMLFIFENSGRHGFWMVNTKIPLDIIWINKEGKIVDISKNTPPCTETGNLQAMCKTYKPSGDALYVLEVNGGWSDTNKVDKGANATFH